MPDGQNTCPQQRVIPPDAVELFAVDFQDSLDSGVTLTGTVTITHIDEDGDAVESSDLTFANKAVNTAALTIEHRSVAIGQAVQFKVSGQVDNTDYRIKISVGTTGTPAQTKIKFLRFSCLDE